MKIKLNWQFPVLVRMGNSRDSSSSLMQMQNDTVTWEDSLSFSHKSKHRAIRLSSIHAPGLLSIRSENLCRKFTCLFLSERGQYEMAIYSMVLIMWYSGKGNTIQTLKDQQLPRIFRVVKPVWSCNYGYTTLWNCQNTCNLSIWSVNHNVCELKKNI